MTDTTMRSKFEATCGEPNDAHYTYEELFSVFQAGAASMQQPVCPSCGDAECNPEGCMGGAGLFAPRPAPVPQGDVEKLHKIIAAAYQIAIHHKCNINTLNVLANPYAADQDQIDALSPYVPQGEQCPSDTETLRKAITKSVVSVSHSIDSGKVILYRDKTQEGNALSQLIDRIATAVQPKESL